MAEQALPRPSPLSPAQPGAPPWGLPVQGNGELGGVREGSLVPAAAPFPRILLGKAAGQEGALGKLESCKPSPVRPSALCDLSWHVCAVGWSQPPRRAAAWHSMAVWVQWAQCGRCRCSGAGCSPPTPRLWSLRVLLDRQQLEGGCLPPELGAGPFHRGFLDVRSEPGPRGQPVWRSLSLRRSGSRRNVFPQSPGLRSEVRGPGVAGLCLPASPNPWRRLATPGFCLHPPASASLRTWRPSSMSVSVSPRGLLLRTPVIRRRAHPTPE